MVDTTKMDMTEFEQYLKEQRREVKSDPDIAKMRKAQASVKWYLRKIRKEEQNAKLAI